MSTTDSLSFSYSFNGPAKPMAEPELFAVGKLREFEISNDIYLPDIAATL